VHLHAKHASRKQVKTPACAAVKNANHLTHCWLHSVNPLQIMSITPNRSERAPHSASWDALFALAAEQVLAEVLDASGRAVAVAKAEAWQAIVHLPHALRTRQVVENNETNTR
jgi:hypothetical protein